MCRSGIRATGSTSRPSGNKQPSYIKIIKAKANLLMESQLPNFISMDRFNFEIFQLGFECHLIPPSIPPSLPPEKNYIWISTWVHD